MTGRPCVTFSVPRMRTCTVRGEHVDACDGFRYTSAGELATYVDPAGTTRPQSCRGCAPAPAVLGYLCESHASKLDYSLRPFDGSPSLLVALTAHLWAANSAGISDGNDRIAGAFGSRVPIPESRIMANTIVDELRAIARRCRLAGFVDLPTTSTHLRATGVAVDATAEQVADVVLELTQPLAAQVHAIANNADVAVMLVRLLAVVQAAFRRWPLSEEPHRTAHVRCPGCGHVAMVWHPPLYYRHEVVVECDDCHTVANQDWLEAYIAAVRVNPTAR